jgi:hypothetical protein
VYLYGTASQVHLYRTLLNVNISDNNNDGDGDGDDGLSRGWGLYKLHPAHP